MKKKEEAEEISFEEDPDFTSSEAEKKIKKLKEKLHACQEDKNNYLNSWQRAQAEFVNARKRDEEDKKISSKMAKEELLLKIIPVVDSFESAFSNKESWESAPEKWRNGVEHIYKQIKSVLVSEGIEEFGKPGEDFDPGFHEALDTVPTKDEKKDGKIFEVIQKGYSFNEKVIRPAKVRVNGIED